MNISAAAVIGVSRLWFYDQTNRHLHARTVALKGLNVCSPPLLAARLLEDRAVNLQQRDTEAAASPERPDEDGGGGR